MLVRKRGTAILVRWPMARGAPASRLSHVSPDVCAGGPCGRTFPCVYACEYRVRARVRTSVFRYTRIRTWPRARECISRERAPSRGDRASSLPWLTPTLVLFAGISALFLSRKEKARTKRKEMRERERNASKRASHPINFIFVNKSDATADVEGGGMGGGERTRVSRN